MGLKKKIRGYYFSCFFFLNINEAGMISAKIPVNFAKVKLLLGSNWQPKYLKKKNSIKKKEAASQRNTGFRDSDNSSIFILIKIP